MPSGFSTAITSPFAVSSGYTLDISYNALFAGGNVQLGGTPPLGALGRAGGYQNDNSLLGASATAQAAPLGIYGGAPVVDIRNGVSGAPCIPWGYNATPLIARPPGEYPGDGAFDVLSYSATLAWLNNDKRLWWSFYAGVNNGAPIVLAGAQAGFGLACFRDDIGGGIIASRMHFVSKRTNSAAYDEDTALDWPVALDQFARVEWRIWSATAIADAKVQLWVNDALLVERSWGAGTVLPDYTANANTICFHPCFVAEGNAQGANAIELRSARFIAGPFDAF